MPSLVRAYEIDLSAAGSRTLPETGNRVHCAVVSGASARVNTTLRQVNQRGARNGPFPLMLGDFVEFPDPFNEVLLEWSAQPGVTMTLLVVDMDPAPLAFQYYINPRGTIDSIANPVTVRTQDQAQAPTQFTATTAAQLALAANPARKGVIISTPDTINVLCWGRSNAVTLINGFQVFGRTVVYVPGNQELWLIASGNTATSLSEVL